MQENLFISHSLDTSIKLYLENKDKEYTKEYNSFLCSIFRMLIIIFGEEELINSYKNNEPEEFDNCLMKFGLEVEELDEFKTNFEKYYIFNSKQEKKTIKKKNKYFNLVQKAVIDMFLQKKYKVDITVEELEEFSNLLFTAKSKDFYRSSTAVVEAYNPYEIDNYYTKHIMGVEV